MSGFDDNELVLLQPSANLKTDARHIKLITLDAQGTNIDLWSHEFYSWLNYIGQVWLIMPGSSEVMSFEGIFAEYFQESGDDSTKQLLMKKAKHTAYVEIISEQIIDLTNEQETSGIGSRLVSPLKTNIAIPGSCVSLRHQTVRGHSAARLVPGSA